jgi:putative two-component system response regulator
MEPCLSAPILIVDDQEPNILVLRALLDRAGYTQVHSTQDSARVLPLIEQLRPDLVLLDLQMPHPDGLSILRELGARLPPDEYLPVLVVTADISPRTKEEALSLGARDFLSKPLNAAELLLRVRNLLLTRLLYTRQQEMNRVLEEKVRERTQDLEAAQAEILERLALAADFRDDVTGQHVRRVGLQSEQLALALGLPPEQAELYRWAAPLHDIGKLGVPDAVLLKPGPLDPSEWDLMKQHTTIGARLLAGSRFPVLELAREIALTHHERWDGTGYAGLAGESIPLSGRIVSVCDVFDALTHERPYKLAWPIDRAIAEIRAQRGRMFDPGVSDAFLLALPAMPLAI